MKSNKPVVKNSIIGIALLVATIIILSSIFYLVGVERIQQFIESAGIFGPFIFILIHTTSIIIAPFEGSVLMLSSGVLFGFWRAVIYTIIAGVLGASINFWLARKYGQQVIAKLLGKRVVEKIEHYSKKVDEHPILLVPLMASTLFDVLGYAAGLSTVKYSSFLIAIIISSIINVPIYVAIGNELIGNQNMILWWIVGSIIIILLIYFLVKGIMFWLGSRKKVE